VAEHQIGADHHRAEDGGRNVRAADALLLPDRDLVGHPRGLALDLLPQHPLERRALRAGDEHLDHVAEGPHQIERLGVGALLARAELAVARRPFRDVVPGERPFGKELLGQLAARLVAVFHPLLERLHQLGEERFFRGKMQIEGALREAACRGDVLDARAVQSAPRELSARRIDQRRARGGVGLAGHAGSSRKSVGAAPARALPCERCANIDRRVRNVPPKMTDGSLIDCWRGYRARDRRGSAARQVAIERAVTAGCV